MEFPLVDKLSVLDYTDYREYLRDLIEANRKKGLKLTNRWFAGLAGINSSSWLTSVLGGGKGISAATARKISEGLRHNKLETRYLASLSAFNQSRTDQERNRHFQDIVRARKSHVAATVREHQYEFYSRWHHSAVRSLIGLAPFKDDYESLARRIMPPITPAQAKKSVKLLERLGLVKRSRQGIFELAVPSITTGESVTSLAVSNFQRETLSLALDAMDRIPPGSRDFSTLTLGISAGKMEEIRRLTREYRKQVALVANTDEKADQVFQLNIQFFPLTSIEGGGNA